MKEIKLANGKGIALVDDKDYEILSNYKWRLCCNNYAGNHFTINGKQKSELMHRIIMNPQKNMEIDHIDNNGLNNQKNNLRIVTHQQNMMNSSKIKNKSSKFKGISWDKNRNKWYTEIFFSGKKYFLGRFTNEIDAARAYNTKAKELFSEYACLNEV